MTVRLGIIGCGEVVVHGHAPILAADQAIQVAGLADLSPGRVEAVAGALGLDGVQGFADHHDLLEQCELDAVLLATPPTLREAIVEDLASAGVFILCEKPIARTLAEADRIIARCAKAGVGLAVCHSWAYFAEYTILRRLVDEGAVGQVHTVILQGLSANPWPGAATYRPGWRDDPEIAGGGRFMDSGLHTLYLMEMLFGAAATSVSAEVCFDPGIAVESRCFSRYRFPAGIGVVNIGRGQGPAAAAVVGTEGRAVIQFPVEAGDLGELPERVVVIRDGRVRATYPVPARGMYTPSFYQAVVRGVEEGDPSALHSGADGRRAVELVLAAYASAARQQPVALPLPPEDAVYQHGLAGLRQP